MSVAKVFKDKKGNRMVFPCFVYEYLEDAPSSSSLWSYGTQLRASTGMDMENDWLELDLDQFPHVVVEIGHSGFAHGAATAWLFDGPEFQAVKEMQN